MDTKAIQKAHRRLEMSTFQLERVGATTTYEDFEREWYFFLVAAKSIFGILEKGSLSAPESKASNRKEFRRLMEIPLVEYFFEARNDDEHGIETVSRKVTMVHAPATGIVQQGPRGYPMVAFEVPPIETGITFGILATVTDKRGRKLPPPKEIVDEVQMEHGAVHAASKYLEYLQSYFETAAEWVG